ncbi:hypothetical protein [Egicoccus sp. AB-alg6-2]|uniref:hypothetical protein n=1 Tax=Egicoccus sp. AB-alg6-2 TaxID=3242692 RepID=UPI00359ED4CA
MADDDKSLPQASGSGTQDFQLVQVLHQSRVLAASRLPDDGQSDAGQSDAGEGDAGWRELEARLGRILGMLGVDGGEPATRPVAGIDRIDRSGFTLEPGSTQRAVASLTALGDRPDDHQLELANRAVRDLEDSLG